MFFRWQQPWNNRGRKIRGVTFCGSRRGPLHNLTHTEWMLFNFHGEKNSFQFQWQGNAASISFECRLVLSQKIERGKNTIKYRMEKTRIQNKLTKICDTRAIFELSLKNEFILFSWQNYASHTFFYSLFAGENNNQNRLLHRFE